MSVENDEPISKIQLIGDNDELLQVRSIVGDEDPYRIIWEPSLLSDVAGLNYVFVRVFERNLLDDDLEEQIAVTAPIRLRGAE